MSGSVAGAEMTTFFAPAWRCFSASGRLVKSPVDSIATSTPRSAQGRSAGSRSETNLISWPSTVIESSPASTGTSRLPSTEACFSRCAIVFVSPMSFAATTSKSPPCWSWARRKFLPMRPKPLIPTPVFAISEPLSSSLAIESNRAGPGEIRSSPQSSRGLRASWQADPGDLAQVVRKAVDVQAVERLRLSVRGAARAHEIGVVRVGEPVRDGAGRGEYGLLLEPEHEVDGAVGDQDVGDHLGSLGIDGRVRAPLLHVELAAEPRRDAGEEAGPIGFGGPDLEARGSRPAERPGTEQRPA